MYNLVVIGRLIDQTLPHRVCHPVHSFAPIKLSYDPEDLALRAPLLLHSRFLLLHSQLLLLHSRFLFQLKKQVNQHHDKLNF